jgi:hypothetical protein
MTRFRLINGLPQACFAENFWRVAVPPRCFQGLFSGNEKRARNGKVKNLALHAPAVLTKCSLFEHTWRSIIKQVVAQDPRPYHQNSRDMKSLPQL